MINPALEFESRMRSSIVESSKALNASGVSFATFAESRCNEQLWSRTGSGGFQLRGGILPSDGIVDIYRNGQLYAFECATAIVIVLYKAILDVIGTVEFNTHFRNLLLYDWHFDDDLRMIRNYSRTEARPGDVLYFKNPDHDPAQPQWQGENVVMLGNNLFYGHGFGIGSSQQLITALNALRRPGSTTSAYLSDLVVHPDFEFLRGLSTRNYGLKTQFGNVDNHVIASVGTTVYIL